MVLPPRQAVPVPAGESLWHSAAFAASGEPEAGTRLANFHRHYGEDVLAAARAGEPARAVRLVEAWSEQNPPRVGDAWHPYVLSTRIANWIAAMSLLPELASPAFSESLWRQLLRLGVNIEDDVLGNHVIRNARALALGGVAFAETRLVDHAVALLRREVPEQVLADGGHYERSPVYHLVVLRDLIEIRTVLGADWLTAPIDRMIRFASALSRPDGAPALFNDGGLDIAPRLDLPTPEPGLAVFPETGYVVVRTARLWLALDCGPPSPPFLPAHAHADALSFQVWWDDAPALVDTGTPTYEPGPERDRLRSTSAHSTVELDGASQFVPWGAFRAGALPDVGLAALGERKIEARVVWRNGLAHVRTLEWSESAVVVRDRIDGTGRHRVTSRLILAPGPRRVAVTALDGTSLRTEQGIVSERFGQREPSDVLVLSREGELPLEFGWRIECGATP